MFQNLPAQMKKCFESQNVQALVDAQQQMEPAMFNKHLGLCIDAGLWAAPGGDDDDTEEEQAKEEKKEEPAPDP